MAKEVATYIKLQVQGGVASPSGTVGPALGSKGVNIMDFCKQFNARTQDKQGELLPVLITVYKDKSFDFIVKTPPSPVLLMKKAQIKKGSPESNRKKVGSVTWGDVEAIATLKMPDLNAFSLPAAMKMIAGTARSIGLTISGESPQTNQE
ncbi:MAG: 50S ribosomal protein L11 [Amoebophilaceae bacterium]|jgi:large subunit ribosomal protein L11|nr:50S ribosomal protein L11 [Amoebophilaceae bacterium]